MAHQYNDKLAAKALWLFAVGENICQIQALWTCNLIDEDDIKDEIRITIFICMNALIHQFGNSVLDELSFYCL